MSGVLTGLLQLGRDVLISAYMLESAHVSAGHKGSVLGMGNYHMRYVLLVLTKKRCNVFCVVLSHAFI